MGSKYMFFLPLLMAVAALHFSAATGAVSRGSQPVIHIISAVKSPLSIKIEADEAPKVVAELSPGQDYEISVDVNDVVFIAGARYGLKFASFLAYQPGRDRGRAAIYWKGDEYGFSISYDNVHYQQVAPWQSK